MQKEPEPQVSVRPRLSATCGPESIKTVRTVEMQDRQNTSRWQHRRITSWRVETKITEMKEVTPEATEK